MVGVDQLTSYIICFLLHCSPIYSGRVDILQIQYIKNWCTECPGGSLSTRQPVQFFIVSN